MSKLQFLSGGPLRLTRELDLARFNEALAGNTLTVWLNPSQNWWDGWRSFADRIKEVQRWTKEKYTAIAALPDEQQAAALAEADTEAAAYNNELHTLANQLRSEVWGCTPDEAAAIYEASEPLYDWATQAALDYIVEYRAGRKKV